MEKLWDTVMGLRGRPIEGALVTITDYPGGGASTIYSDDGTTEIPDGKMTTDETGYFEYYAADGRYTWTITSTEGSRVINDVRHGSSTSAPSNEPFLVATGTGDAMVLAAFAAGYTLVDGAEIRVRAPGENTVTNPTINIPSVGVLTIYKLGGEALNAQVGGVAGTGDIHRAGHEITLRYRASPERMELIGVI